MFSAHAVAGNLYRLSSIFPPPTAPPLSFPLASTCFFFFGETEYDFRQAMVILQNLDKILSKNRNVSFASDYFPLLFFLLFCISAQICYLTMIDHPLKGKTARLKRYMFETDLKQRSENFPGSDLLNNCIERQVLD